MKLLFCLFAYFLISVASASEFQCVFQMHPEWIPKNLTLTEAHIVLRHGTEVFSGARNFDYNNEAEIKYSLDGILNPDEGWVNAYLQKYMLESNPGPMILEFNYYNARHIEKYDCERIPLQ